MSAIELFLTTSVFAFTLTFARIGTALMLLPGIGDAFVSPRTRLHFAAAFSLLMFPLTIPLLPDPLPDTTGLFLLIGMEFMIGLFFGSLARVFMSALDTAGMGVSISAALSNAQLFNPSFASQGSLMGALFSMTGLALLFMTDLHHLLFMGIMESYALFPVGSLPEVGSMAELFSRAVAKSFAVGIMIASPFIVLSLLVYTGMGVLGRLMPQIQVFILALPIQILLAITLLMIVMPAAMLFWLRHFEDGMVFFLSVAQ